MPERDDRRRAHRREDRPESFTWRDPSTLGPDERKAYDERKAQSDAEIRAFVDRQRAAVEEWHEEQATARREAQNKPSNPR